MHVSAPDGVQWTIRRQKQLGWTPRWRGKRRDGEGLDLGTDVFDLGDDLGVLVLIPLVIVAAVALVFALPLVLFVLELAVVFAVLVPVVVLAAVIGVTRHNLVATNTVTGQQIVRPTRGAIASVRAKRAWATAIRSGRTPTAS